MEVIDDGSSRMARLDWLLRLQAPINALDEDNLASTSRVKSSENEMRSTSPVVPQKGRKRRANRNKESSPTTSCSGFSNNSPARNNSVVFTPPHTPENSKSPTIDYRTVNVKPPYSYQAIICMALQAQENQKITLCDLYDWVRENFAYYRCGNNSWKNSIRHNLSLNRAFEKVPRADGVKTKGHFWTFSREDQQPSTSTSRPASQLPLPAPAMTKSTVFDRKRHFNSEEPMDACAKRPCASFESPFRPASSGMNGQEFMTVNSPPLPEIVLTFSENPHFHGNPNLPPQDESHLHVDLGDAEGAEIWADNPNLCDRDYIFPDNYDLLQEMDVDGYTEQGDQSWIHEATKELNLKINPDLLDVYCSDL